MIDGANDTSSIIDVELFDQHVQHAVYLARDLHLDDATCEIFGNVVKSFGDASLERRLDAVATLMTDTEFPEALRFLGLDVAFALDLPVQITAIDALSNPRFFGPNYRNTGYLVALTSDYERVQEIALDGFAVDLGLTDSQRRAGLRFARNSEFSSIREVADRRLHEFA